MNILTFSVSCRFKVNVSASKQNEIIFSSIPNVDTQFAVCGEDVINLSSVLPW